MTLKQVIRPLLSSIILLFCLAPSQGHSQILIEEGGEPVVGRSLFGNNQTRNEGFYLTSKSLRQDRRVGIGMGFAGKLGLAGVNIELNFTPDQSVVVAFGGGSPFQSFSFDWKYLFDGRYFSPYFSAGYTRWFNSEKVLGGIQDPLPNILTSRYLSESEIASGQFALDFITPAAGIQYHQLSGPYRGISLYAEVVVLTDMRNFEPVPTGAMGAYYYF